MNRADDLDAQFVGEFKALFDDTQPVIVEISKYQAWCLMAAIQLACRHPEARGKTPIEESVKIARTLQGAIALTPRLMAVAKAGWES